MIIGWRNQSKNHSPDAHCNEYMAKQQGCFAAQQSCAAKSFFAFRHHIIIIMPLYHHRTAKKRTQADKGDWIYELLSIGGDRTALFQGGAS
jgi:hypothetical protein